MDKVHHIVLTEACADAVERKLDNATCFVPSKFPVVVFTTQESGFPEVLVAAAAAVMLHNGSAVAVSKLESASVSIISLLMGIRSANGQQGNECFGFQVSVVHTELLSLQSITSISAAP